MKKNYKNRMFSAETQLMLAKNINTFIEQGGFNKND